MSYSLEFHHQGATELVIDCENDLDKVRRVAASRRFNQRLKHPGSRLVILRDGKQVQGGRYALDILCYNHWLEQNHQRSYLHFWMDLCPELW